MKTLFCLSDVHSFYKEMIESLDRFGYDINNPDHILIHCGDLLDRGPQPLECLKFVNSIPKNNKILIRGNHEDLLENIFSRGYFCWHDIHNGTVETVYNISNMDISKDIFIDYLAIKQCSKNQELIKYYESLVDYFEINNYIFVHGWIPINTKYKIHIDYKSRNNGEWKYGDWASARWFNGMEKWSQGEILDGKTIVCGHWDTAWGHHNLHNLGLEIGEEYYENEVDTNRVVHFEPFIDEGIVALDACTVYSGLVNCYKIEVEDDKWLLNM